MLGRRQTPAFIDEIGQRDLAAGRPGTAHAGNDPQPIMIEHRCFQALVEVSGRGSHDRELDVAAEQIALLEGGWIAESYLKDDTRMQPCELLDQRWQQPRCKVLFAADAQLSCTGIS